MKTSKVTLPIFPLPVFLLPHGITRLRIFEPRYLKMVSIAAKGDGFAILLNTKDKAVAETHWASWVDIVNFDQGNDGMLIIDVKCKALVEIESMTTEADNLRFGVFHQVEHWSQNESDDIVKKLSSSLLKVFNENNELSNLYQDKFFGNAHWVVARWLELLPTDVSAKCIFANDHSYEQAKEFVQTIIFQEK